eukprot:m.172101 g.172101  ORF g.172101 m.172101 type:complete len:118 (-) comp16714_c0_seq7:3220-3573(-)
MTLTPSSLAKGLVPEMLAANSGSEASKLLAVSLKTGLIFNISMSVEWLMGKKCMSLPTHKCMIRDMRELPNSFFKSKESLLLRFGMCQTSLVKFGMCQTNSDSYPAPCYQHLLLPLG